MESILQPTTSRLTMFPIQYPAIWKMYKQHVASFWTVEEIDFSQDIQDWMTLSPSEQHFLKHIFAFFAASDGIVIENLALKFCSEVTIPEARAFYSFQIAMENIHSETYSLIIDTLLSSTHEKLELFDALEHFPSVAKKAAWALKWVSNEFPFAQRLLAFAVVEGVFFSGSFCAIFWLRKRCLFPGVTFSNELISRDEGLHTEFACLIYSYIERRLSTETVYGIMSEAINIEKEFIVEALPVELIGMNSKLMGEYLECVADRLLVALGYEKLYRTSNPFEWMEMISVQGKTNFFEKRVSEYRKSGVMAAKQENVFRTDMEF